MEKRDEKKVEHHIDPHDCVHGYRPYDCELCREAHRKNCRLCIASAPLPKDEDGESDLAALRQRLKEAEEVIALYADKGRWQAPCFHNEAGKRFDQFAYRSQLLGYNDGWIEAKAYLSRHKEADDAR
jgi:hypothetical protein